MKNFIIYKSSAGSGKTYTLVREYIRLALSTEGGYRHILAVTFTNKAADEMKTRIISSLIALSQRKDKKLEKLLIEGGVKGDVAFKSSQVLQDILHKYSYFSVSTIDSFFHKIIRSFARELNLPLGYNVEIETDIVIDKITEELLDEIGSRPELTKYIEDYVFYNIDENKGWKIDAKIKELAVEILKERYWIKKGDDDSLAEDIEKMQGFIGTLFAIINDFEERMTVYSDTAMNMLDEYSLLVEDFPHGKGGYMGYILRRIRNKDYDPKQRASDAATNINKCFNKKSKPAVQAALQNGLFKILQDVIELYHTGIKKYITSKELIKTVHVLGIYRDLKDKLRNYRDENKLMLISDTTNILEKIISDDNSPFVYEKTGTIYNNFLIDEFQDTSTYQWKNFKPLIENSLGENNFSMIVGDVKQSIYRWRNGNMKLLLGDVKNDLALFNDAIEEEKLEVNHRSRKEIIEFNNKFFTLAAAKLTEKWDNDEKLFEDTYKDTIQTYDKALSGGYVNVSFIPVNDEDISTKEIALQKTVEAVKEALESGFRQKDIMILTRGKKDGSQTAHYLTDAGFKVVSNDSLMLTSSPKVKLAVNILKYIVDKKDDLARTEILYNYMVYIKKETPDLNAIFNDYKLIEGSLFSSKLPPDFFAKGDTTKLNPQIFRLSLYELVEMLIRIFELNDNADAYLLRFMDVITEFTSESSNDLPGFINWWNENNESCSIVIPEEEDAVRVMTIHKAKGLQSLVVILPNANWKTDIQGNRDLIWVSSNYPPFNESSAFIVKATKALGESYFEKDYTDEAVLTQLDNLNLLYVAFTRAVERLHVFIPENKSTAYNTSKLIRETLNSSGEFLAGFKDEIEFESGARTLHKVKDDPGESSYKPGGLVSTSYQSKVVIKPAAGGLSIEKRKKLEESKNRGRILHKALSHIRYPEDAEKAVGILKIEGKITSENEDEIINELVEILKISEVRKWFSKEYEIKTEAEILLPDGIMYKPDRVLLRDNKAIVVDYKTGRHHKEHETQVKQYADVLSKMGYPEIEKYLFYVPERKIVKV